MGFYPPPPGASDVIGLECSGTVEALGDDVTGWSVGDEVCALLAGGGYAELVAVPAGQLMPVPAGVSLVEAAALPEVACTVWSNVFMLAGLQATRSSWSTEAPAGSAPSPSSSPGPGREGLHDRRLAEKLAVCAELGADVTINYRDEDFVEILTAAGGADVILDNMGAAYLDRNVTALANEGRLVIIGMQGGTKAELDINKLLRKRGAVLATSLRARPTEEKAAICASVVEHVWPLVADGTVRPVVHTTLPLAEAARAHQLMEDSDHVGKIVLTA